MTKHARLRTTVLALLAVTMPASAGVVGFQVTVDTSSLASTNGYLEFQFNSGSLPAADIQASVFGFTGATVNPADPSNFSSTGTFPLPGTLTLLASSSTDYFEAITFGNLITFSVSLSGPGVDLSGNAGSSSSTRFIINFLDASVSAFLLTDDPSGVVGYIDVSPEGLVTTAVNPDPLGGPSLALIEPLTDVPEPATWMPALSSLLIGFWAAKRSGLGRR